MSSTSKLLTVNSGSSSIKFCLFDLSEDLPLVVSGKVTDIGHAAKFQAHKDGKEDEHALPSGMSIEDGLGSIIGWLAKNGVETPDIKAVAHRIVHGGEKFISPVLLTAKVMADLRSLCPLAPLHQVHNLAGVDILSLKMPAARQYGCFDTAFHAQQDKLHSSFALPEAMRTKGVRRYGFHGLSYSWILRSLRADLPHLLAKRIVVAHLGNGASLCAIKNGTSVETTMSLTPLDGLPMGTRSGAIDAGAVIYMQRELGLSVDDAENLLYKESGLQGLSGISNDVEALTASTDERAQFALDYFVLKTAQYIAAMAVAQGGIDALLFTGGIGENAANIRNNILARLAFFPPFETHVITANEERGMALDIFENFGEELSHGG